MTATVSPASELEKCCRVVLVEDNADAARAMAISLERERHLVESTRNGTEALVVAERFKPHAVIVDIGLPGLDGLHVARQLRRSRRDLLIIAATGRGSQEDLARSREAGCDHHLVKPLDFQRVHQLLEGWKRQSGCDH